MNLEWPLSLNATLALAVVCMFVTIVFISVHDDTKFVMRKDQLALGLSALGGIALLITIYDRQSNARRQLKQDEYRTTMDDLNNQRLNFMAPLKDILSYYPESVPIYYEMFGTNGTTGVDEKVLATINPSKRKMVEQTIALTIFQIVENFLSVSTLTSPQVLTEWMSRLVVWFQSPTLQA